MDGKAFVFGNLEVLIYEKNGIPSMTVVPGGSGKDVVLGKQGSDFCLAQTHVRGVPHRVPYSAGLTMLGSETSYGYRLDEARQDENKLFITLKNDNGLVYRQKIEAVSEALVCCSSLINESDAPITIDHASSFCLSCLTPFAEGAASEQLVLHRFTSFWSAEGRHQADPLAKLNMEPSWAKWGIRSTRIGQIGSMPVRGYFPTVGLEDTENNVTWAVNLAWAGSWNIEIFRQNDDVILSGGLAGFDQGHFRKTLAPGETLILPEACITAVHGGIDEACEALLSAQNERLVIRGKAEEEAAPMYNEYLDTWGNPSEQTVWDELNTVKDLGLSYFVIDAGWYGNGGDWSSSTGDWQVRKSAFPNGLKTVAAAIRKCGMVPGIWFEAEVASEKSDIFREHPEMFMHDGGKPILETGRAFLNLTREDAHRYLDEKVISFLKNNGFGYIKIDYNNTYGIGFDGFESQGEANYRNVWGTYRFFEDMQSNLPELIVENCASGGHRLEAGMMQRCSLASFSDAHECRSIPLIAADLHRLILPRQSQIWAAIKPEDPDRRIIWSLCAALLGRMCLSGPLQKLNEGQIALVKNGIRFYKLIAPLLIEGNTKVYREGIRSYECAEGWQTVVRRGTDRAMVIAHVFKNGKNRFTVDAGLEGYKVTDMICEQGCGIELTDGKMMVYGSGDYYAIACLLEKV